MVGNGKETPPKSPSLDSIERGEKASIVSHHKSADGDAERDEDEVVEPEDCFSPMCTSRY